MILGSVSAATSTSQFFEDVSSESLVFNRKGLETARSTSHFFEDVPSETAEQGGTYPDKNGKRRFSEFAFARAHGLAPRKTVRTWGAVAETP